MVLRFGITDPNPSPKLRPGFYQAVLGCLRVRAGGLMTLGPPCGSYVWINSNTHGRSRDEPFGDESKQYVQMGSLSPS